MADRDFVVNNGIHTVGNSFVANTSGILLNANVTFANTVRLVANGSVGSSNQMLSADSSGGIFWKNPPAAVNTSLDVAFTNTVSFRGNVVFANVISVNGSYGTAGQVLVYNGSNSYWTDALSSITGSGALSQTGTAREAVVSLDAISPSPAGSYALPAITVDTYGRVTAASVAGSGGVQTINTANSKLITVSGTVSSGDVAFGYYGAVTINLANVYALGTTKTFGGGDITVDTAGRITAATNAFSSNVTFSNNFLTAPAMKAFSEYVSDVTTTSATTTLDLSTSNFFNVTVSRNTTLAFTNAPSGRAYSFNVVLTQDSTGGWTVSLPVSCKYPNGLAPTKTTTANSTDIWTFTTYNGGTTYMASLSIKNASTAPVSTSYTFPTGTSTFTVPLGVTTLTSAVGTGGPRTTTTTSRQLSFSSTAVTNHYTNSNSSTFYDYTGTLAAFYIVNVYKDVLGSGTRTTSATVNGTTYSFNYNTATVNDLNTFIAAAQAERDALVPLNVPTLFTGAAPLPLYEISIHSANSTIDFYNNYYEGYYYRNASSAQFDSGYGSAATLVAGSTLLKDVPTTTYTTSYVTGSSTTGFGKTFPGAPASTGVVPTTTFANVAVTPLQSNTIVNNGTLTIYY